MLRVALVVGFLVLSAGLILAAFLGPSDGLSSSLLINLGTEVFGILVTVAVVEWLFERRRLQDRARQLAWSTLHAMERAVWVWQGGPRRLGTEELLGLIGAISPDDPMPPSTQALLTNLGARAKEVLQRDAGTLRSLPGLREALDDLTSLNSIREGGSPVSLRMVSEVLESSALGLARVLGQPTERMSAGLIRYRDSSLEAQEERYNDSEGHPLPGRSRGLEETDEPGEEPRRA